MWKEAKTGGVMKEFFQAVLFVAATCVFFWIMFCVSGGDNIYYEYTDLDGNTGEAQDCSTRRTIMYCKNEHTRFLVKSFTRKSR